VASALVRGNHDKTVASLDNLEWFNEAARAAIQWTHDALAASSLRKLSDIPSGPLPVLDRLLICHGSPMDEDLYITRHRDVERSFEYMDRHHPGTRVCFFGHTHVPLIVDEDGEALVPPERFVLQPERRYLINPGSVGQPRDRDPRASFGVLEIEEADSLVYRHYRVEYPVERTQEKIRGAGLPSMLAERLARGW
jgi:diadenosine tetraphosphatase ApaH/serine/threonine PP2A family protein phosphatase